MNILIIAALVSAVAAQTQPPQGRDLAAQLRERIFLLQKEFELLVRQFNRIRSGNARALAQVTVPEIVPIDPASLQTAVAELEQTRQVLDEFISKHRQGRQNPEIPGVGSLPFVGQISQVFSGAGFNQLTGLFTQLTSQLQSLTRIISSIAGSLTRIGGEGGSSGGANPFVGLTGAGSPFEQLTSTLSGLTGSLSGLTNMFRING